MKFVAITFDDGRSNNYTTAFPVMEKYSLQGTLFVTTGFVDHTWQKNETWLSAGDSLTIEQLRDLRQAGWELALHGDRHTVQTNDTRISIEKMNTWLGRRDGYGFSIPNSDADSAELIKMKALCYEEGLLKYIRTGRGRSTKGLSAKLLFGMYSVLGLQKAYNRFNAPSVNDLSHIDKTDIKSVVVRLGDKPEMISRFVRQVPDNSLVVLMLHSVLHKEDALYGADPWCWDSDSFERLCMDLWDMDKNDIAKTMTLEGVLANVSI